MALFARQGLMLAQQRELGLGVVIEDRALPAFGGVAGFALGAVAALMDVLRFVAVVASDREIFVALAHMARFAGHGLMPAGQGEFRLAVIKASDLAPGFWVVARCVRIGR